MSLRLAPGGRSLRLFVNVPEYEAEKSFLKEENCLRGRFPNCCNIWGLFAFLEFSAVAHECNQFFSCILFNVVREHCYID